MNFFNKCLLIVLAAAVLIFISAWVFNHLDPWAGIGTFLVGLYFLVVNFINLVKELLNEEV